MLEAAMLGVPYVGRVPDYNAPAAPAGPVAAEVAAHRDLRREQDDAYAESLRVRRPLFPQPCVARSCNARAPCATAKKQMCSVPYTIGGWGGVDTFGLQSRIRQMGFAIMPD